METHKMPRIFNKNSEKTKREYLRKNMPKAELLLWTKLKGKQLKGYKFRRQYSVNQYIIDFYCPKAKLAIEIDGDSHLDKKTVYYDQKKQASIEAFGIKFLRFNNLEIFESLDGVINEIQKHLN
ncbi:MAG: endonuclease domain-containing protein [Nitrospinaceae bacterium]